MDKDVVMNIKRSTLILNFCERTAQYGYLQMKIGLFLGLIFVSANSYGASPDIAVISTSEGETQVSLTELDRVVAESAGVARVVFSNGSSLTVSDPELLTLRFVDSSEGGVDVPTCDKSLRIEAGAVVSELGKIVEVFNASGAMVAKSSAGLIPTQMFTPGIYFARQGGATLEFVVN